MVQLSLTFLLAALSAVSVLGAGHRPGENGMTKDKPISRNRREITELWERGHRPGENGMTKDKPIPRTRRELSRRGLRPEGGKSGGHSTIRIVKPGLSRRGLKPEGGRTIGSHNTVRIVKRGRRSSTDIGVLKGDPTFAQPRGLEWDDELEL